jgi:hypothetical protein
MIRSLPRAQAAAAIDCVKLNVLYAFTQNPGLLDAEISESGFTLPLNSPLLVPVGLTVSDEMQLHD